MIACFSKKFVKAQTNYSTTDEEALAVEKGMLQFDHYLRGKRFTLKTDHQALQYIKTASNHKSRILRTALKLQEYDYNPVYIKGETNISDILSRPSENLIVNTVQVKEVNDWQKQAILRNYFKLLGHGSAAKMKFIMKDQHDWKGIRSDIEMFVKNASFVAKQENH